MQSIRFPMSSKDNKFGKIHLSAILDHIPENDIDGFDSTEWSITANGKQLLDAFGALLSAE